MSPLFALFLILKELLHEKKCLFEALMLFHTFVRIKTPECFIFASVLALEIFPYYAFICKFKIQFLSKW